MVGNDDLAGADVAHKLGAHGVQRAGLGSKGVACTIGQFADAQGAEAVGVPGGDELGVGHDDQAVRALNVVHGTADSHFNVGGQQTVLGQQITDDLGVRGAVEDGTAHLQLAAQLGSVDQVAVVADGHGALAVVQDHGLGVGAAALACGGITHMAGGHLGVMGQIFQHALGKDFAHKTQVAVAGQHAVHVQGDAAAFLAAVLQGVQGAVHRADHVGLAGLVINTEYAAFFVQGFGKGRFTHVDTSQKISKKTEPDQPSRRFMTSW